MPHIEGVTKEDRMEWLMTRAGYKTTVVNDGSVDKKGRKVGHYATAEFKTEDCNVQYWEPVVDEALGRTFKKYVCNEDGSGLRFSGPCRRMVSVEVYPTRDGELFGPAWRAGTLVATWEEAFALGEKKLAAYARKVAKAAGSMAVAS